MTWPIFGDHKQKLKAIYRLVMSSEDAITAVLGGSLLEEAVERTLRERMRDDADGTERLFQVNRPLANVAAQIDTLYMLWGIDEPARQTMRAIAQVRNVFAHDLEVTFDSTNKDLTKGFSRMLLHKAFSHYPDARFGTPTSLNVEPVTSKRECFIVNLKLSLNLLMQDRCSHKAYSQEKLSKDELRASVGDPMP